MAAETWLLICVLFWSLQSRLAAPQVTAKPCHFGLCQLLKSSAPAVLALRSWLTSFKQAIWHKSQLLVSLCGRATSPRGVIYIPWLLGSLQKYSERKTTCQEDARFGKHHDQGKQERKITEKSGSSKFVSLGWNFLGGGVFSKRQLKLNPSGKCHHTVVQILNHVLQMSLQFVFYIMHQWHFKYIFEGIS